MRPKGSKNKEVSTGTMVLVSLRLPPEVVEYYKKHGHTKKMRDVLTAAAK